LISAPANAVELDDRWYIAPALSYIKADQDRDADNALGFRLGIGKTLNELWDIEANLAVDSLDFKNGSGKYKQKGLGLDALYFFSRDTHFSPYAVIGAGILNTKTVGQSANAMINAGLGFQANLADNGLALRADARYRADFDDYSVSSQRRFGDWIFNLGLVIPLGSKAKPAPVVAPIAAPVLAAPAVVMPTPAAPAAPMDSDADGVIDSQDLCPNSPAGAKVNGQGCELDSDGDGIVDSHDRCPNSKAGTKVDNNGCGIPEVIILKGVNFETSSDRLTHDSVSILNGVADILSRRSEISIEVGGHTDNQGAAALNEKLSKKRAQAVANYLVSRGVKANQLTAKGYGATSPIADNHTAAGRTQNRRVELHILQD
jgi:OOP family OmpA-OmpF porin